MSELVSILSAYSATSTSYCLRKSLGNADKPPSGSLKAFLQVGQLFVLLVKHLKQKECKQGRSLGSVKNLEHNLQVAWEKMDWDFGSEDERGCLDLLADAGFILIDSNKKIVYKAIQVATLLIVLVRKSIWLGIS